MSKLDTNFVKQLYSSKGVELTPEKLQYISENYTSNEELESSFNMKYSDPQEPKTDPKKKTKNSTTTSTKTPSVSPTQQSQRKPTSVGGKPLQTGASASSAGKSEDLINRFGIKPGEKIEGIERKAYEAQRNMPKVGTTKTQPVVSTKPVSENLTKKLDEKYDVLSKIPAITEKIEKQTKLTPDELLVISKQQDLVINEKYNPTISEDKLKDELDEYQFLDGISEGIRSSTNKFLLQPLTEVNKYFGGDKDFTIKKGVPLATEKEQAEKELIEEKGFGNFSKEDVLEKAKTIFLKNDELSQKINATDSYFSTLPDGHQVQRDLWIKTKADSLKSNEDIKKKAQLLQVNADRIQAYNDFIVGINEKGFASEEDKVKYNELLSLAQKAQEENDLLRKSFKDDLLKLDKDNEKLELLKFNYNDLEKSWDLWNKGVGTIIGGSLKLIGETRELVFEETVGRLTGINYEDPLSKAGDFVSSLGKEDVKQYRMMSLDDVNNWGDAGSWFGQLLMEQGPILAFMSTGGRVGLEIVSMSSGGSKIQEMEDSEKQPFAKKYSQFEKVAAGWSYYGAEKYTEKFSTFKYLDDLKSSLKNISSSSRELAENSFKKETAKVIGSTLLQSQVEGASEAVTELSNSLTDIYLLGDKLSSNEISKRMKNAYASGVTIGGGMSVTGAFTTFASKELRAISDNKDISEVRGILGKLETINKEINSNLLLTDQDKTNLEKKANDLMNKATSIVAKSVDNIEKFSIEEISNLLDINKEQSELKTEFDNLRKSAMSSDLKKEEYDDLNKKFTALEKKRNDIINRTYEGFNYLPEEEQTKLKVEAAEAIIQEQVDKGVERDNIQEPNAEVINKKAKELYNQKIQEDAKRKQTDGQITSEEKPTTRTEEQTVSTAQQVDAGVQTQEEVVTPKIQEDAIQEQVTDEGVLQPGQSEMGLQEMEQGDTKQEDVTEQGEEKVTVYHGGSVSNIESINESEPLFVTQDRNEAIAYSRGNEGNVYTAELNYSKIGSEEIARDILSDMGYDDEYMLHELIDPRFEDSYIGDENVKKLFSEIENKGYIGIEFMDSGIDSKRNVTNIFLVNPKKNLKNSKLGERVIVNERNAYDLFEEGFRPIVNGDVIEDISEDDLGDLFRNSKNIEMTNPKNKIISEEKVKLQEEVKKASDRLSKAYDAYKNIGIVFDPKGNWKKDKELVSSLVDFAVSNIKFGAYNTKVLIEDLAKKGIEISKENAKYIFDKANKKFKSDINKAVGIKPKATEQKRINKAYDIGVAFQKLKTVAEKDKAALIKSLKSEANAFIKASITDLKAGDIGNRAITSIASKIQSITDKNFEEKLLEINTVLDNLYTNRDVNTAKSDSKKAFDNVISGKVGKLDKRGDRDKVMSSKIVNFTKLEPKRLKMVLDDADFEQYKDYISRLSGRGLTLEETDLPTIEKIFDKIVKPYSDYVAEVNRIQQIIDAGGTLTKGESDFIENNKSEFSERETPETLADKEAKKLERDAKKEAEIAKKKASIKELLPSINSVFESSNAVKGSLEWRILDALIGLSESDVDSMPDNMLTNALNAISSMVYDDVIPAYTEDLYKYKLKTDYKNALVETLKKSGKAGVYKLKVAKIPLKLREVIGLPLMSLIKGINKKNIDQQVIDRRIKFFNLSAIDAAVKVYGDTPLFNAFMSSFGKAMSRIASAEEKVEAVLLKAKRDLDKNSKNPQESYMKIVYHLIDTMAKNNVGTTSSISAMEYFEATVNDPNSKIGEDNYMKGLVQGFIDKVGANNNQIEDLTPEEANAANAIRIVLDENQINAYEANLFQNSNAAPMIVEYFPVFNSVVKQAENDLARLKSKFGIDSVSIKAGSLEDKTGTAHPIDLNPFTSAFSSVRNVLFQHQLRSEYAAITQAIKEAIAENSTDNDVLPYLKGIKKALDSQFDLLINGAIHTEPTLTDKILNGTDRAFYTLALGSIISRGVDFAGNMVQLMTINPKYISYSNKVSNALINIKKDSESETELIRNFYENAEASDVNKMISSKKINTERTEFINKGINKEVLSKGLPSSNIGAKLKSKITGPIKDTASGAVDILLGFGDVKPYAISWNGVFYEEFLKQTGEEVDIEKIARGDVEYLKKYKDAISKASNKANRENADLYGSTNPMEKKVGIMEIASKQVKNSVPGAVNALVNKAAYLFASFDMNARNDMNTAVNTYIENQEGRNARRFLGGAIRLSSYSLAINYITGSIWGWLKGDDDDEEKLKVSFDKLSVDDDFIKEVNNSLLDYPIQKDADGNIIEITGEDLIKYNQMRDKLMQNKDFAAAYDIVYGYVNRDLFDLEVMNKVGEINQGKYEYDKSSVEVFFSDMDNGFGKSDNEIIGVLGLLNSQQGYKLFTEEEIDSYILKLEKYMSETNFLSNRAIRESSGQIDRLIVTKTASILSDYRSNKSAEEVTTTEGLKLFMGMMFSRSNNFTKAAYNFTAELANKQMVQSRRGDRGYDAFKDNVFQTPIKAGLTEVAIKKQLTKDVFNILFPAINKMDRYSTTDHSIPDLVRFTPLGILGANDFAKIDSEMRNDVIYQNTNGKYKENIIKDIKETKIDILRDEDKVKKDSADSKFKKSRVIPAINQTKLKSKFPSYKYGKDLKVNGNKAN